MTQNWHMTNAQEDLMTRRPHAPVRDIGTIAASYQPGTVWEADEPPPPPVRSYRVTPFADFKFDHLTPDQAGRLRYGLDKAQTWMNDYAASPGLSFVIAGPVGTGKTTIAENLMQSFRRKCIVSGPVHSNGDSDYAEMLKSAMEKLSDNDPRRAEIAKLIHDDVTGTAVEVMDGMLVEATELMRIMAAETPLDNTFGRCRVIVVDDSGSEEIDFSNERTEVRKRHARYGRFFDYCYRKRKHVIVTSMDSLMKGNSIDSEFVNIFGQKAFSRLYQMAGGFMVDLSGLPDYRPYVIAGG